eukprot:SAG31_NODE_747_length_12395_cov_129.196405_3_plen_685_part_00
MRPAPCAGAAVHPREIRGDVAVCAIRTHQDYDTMRSAAAVVRAVDEAICCGVHCHTGTNVLAIERVEGSGSAGSVGRPHRYTVKTDRGDVFCETVVVCTNAYIGGLVPELSDKIRPVRNHVLVTAPGPRLLRDGKSCGMGMGGFNYWIQRSDGRVVLGGFRDKEEVSVRSDGVACGVDVFDDSTVDSGVFADMKSFLATTFEGYKFVPVEQEWTGILGWSCDDMPWVGELPGSPGFYVCAGFCGSGLWRAFGCGTAVAEKICGLVPHAWVNAWEVDLSRDWTADLAAGRAVSLHERSFLAETWRKIYSAVGLEKATSKQQEQESDCCADDRDAEKIVAIPVSSDDEKAQQQQQQQQSAAEETVPEGSQGDEGVVAPSQPNDSADSVQAGEATGHEMSDVATVNENGVEGNDPAVEEEEEHGQQQQSAAEETVPEGSQGDEGVVAPSQPNDSADNVQAGEAAGHETSDVATVNENGVEGNDPAVEEEEQQHQQQSAAEETVSEGSQGDEGVVAPSQPNDSADNVQAGEATGHETSDVATVNENGVEGNDPAVEEEEQQHQQQSAAEETVSEGSQGDEGIVAPSQPNGSADNVQAGEAAGHETSDVATVRSEGRQEQQQQQHQQTAETKGEGTLAEQISDKASNEDSGVLPHRSLGGATSSAILKPREHEPSDIPIQESAMVQNPR